PAQQDRSRRHHHPVPGTRAGRAGQHAEVLHEEDKPRKDQHRGPEEAAWPRTAAGVKATGIIPIVLKAARAERLTFSPARVGRAWSLVRGQFAGWIARHRFVSSHTCQCTGEVCSRVSDYYAKEEVRLQSSGAGFRRACPVGGKMGRASCFNPHPPTQVKGLNTCRRKWATSGWG